MFLLKVILLYFRFLNLESNLISSNIFLLIDLPDEAGHVKSSASPNPPQYK